MTFCIVNITVSLTCRTRILQRKFSHHHIQVWTGSHADGRVAKEISGNSGVGEGERISVLKDFRTLMRKLLFSGHSSWLRHPGCISGNYSARFSVIEVITSVIHLPILSIISCNFAM